MIMKLVSNSPFLIFGLLMLFFAKVLSMAAEKPKNVRHARGEVTEIGEKHGSSSYRAKVRFQTDDGHMMEAMIPGLCNVREASTGDWIEIDYYPEKNGRYYATTDDPRYISGSSPEANRKQSRVLYGVAFGFFVFYAVMTIYGILH